MNILAEIPALPVSLLHRRLGFPEPLEYPRLSLSKPLADWKMEIDDAPIFRYLYRNFSPKRHLEFGTWEGKGVTYCLEECRATVWTINLPFGEDKPEGGPAYSYDSHERESVASWAKKIGTYKDRHCLRTDSIGFVGRYYLEKNLGHRVCQIYCDSAHWDTSHYPPGFFDSVLIDGAHTPEGVIEDTRKALPLLREGGLVMWHDFCPDEKVRSRCSAPKNVVSAIESNWEWIAPHLSDAFWIDPSWILLGVVRKTHDGGKFSRGSHP